jgi:competence protein ComEC
MGFLICVVSGFASGIFLRSVFVFNWPVILFVILLSALFGAAAFLKPRRAYSLGVIFCLFIALGMIRAIVADTPLPQSFASELRHRVSYQGVVVSDPDIRDANQRIEVAVASGREKTIVLAVVPRTTIVSVGDTVRASGTLLVPEAFADDGGHPSPEGSGGASRVFNYEKYLQRDGVRFILDFGSINVLQKAPWYSIGAALANIKHLFLNGLQATLPEPYASLAGGVVIGGKTGLGSDLQNAFIRSGLVQIIVLSGYNVMIVAEWVMAALALTKLSKRWSASAGALAILIFVGIAGTSATAMRAALMAFIALYARATGRTYTAGRALLLVVFLMILWNPLYLAYDPGFGLSVAATAGIIWLAPIIEMLIKIKNNFWKNTLATTIAAQIAVLPLLLYDTGNLSLVAIPANLLTMPMVPLAMGLSTLSGFAGMLFSKIIPLLGITLAFPAYVANAYIIFIARGASALPFAAFTLPAFPFWLVLVAYAALIFIASSKRFSTTLQLSVSKSASI